jgi:hypothetical protein
MWAIFPARPLAGKALAFARLRYLVACGQRLGLDANAGQHSAQEGMGGVCKLRLLLRRQAKLPAQASFLERNKALALIGYVRGPAYMFNTPQSNQAQSHPFFYYVELKFII